MLWNIQARQTDKVSADSLSVMSLNALFANGRPLCADIVAKVFLRGGTQILRPVDAAIE